MIYIYISVLSSLVLRKKNGNQTSTQMLMFIGNLPYMKNSERTHIYKYIGVRKTLILKSKNRKLFNKRLSYVFKFLIILVRC